MVEGEGADHMELNGTGVIITGASQGLGRALAEALGKRGTRLALVARGQGPLEVLVERLRGEGIEAHGLPADIGEQQAIVPVASQAQALVGPIDLLINNASTLGPTPLRPLLDTECEDLSRVLEVNLVGAFRLTKAVAGSMAVRGRGCVINVSSDAATEAYPSWGSYSVAKAGLDHLTRVWAAELEDLQFWSLDPGEMDTAMHAAALPESDPASLRRPEAVAEAIVSLIEHGRTPSGTRVDPLETLRSEEVA